MDKKSPEENSKGSSRPKHSFRILSGQEALDSARANGISQNELVISTRVSRGRKILPKSDTDDSKT